MLLRMMRIYQSPFDMKTCFKCHQQKPLEEFYKHPQMADGYLNNCKVCKKRESIERRFGDRREYVLEYDRQRAKAPHRKEQKKRINFEYYKNLLNGLYKVSGYLYGSTDSRKGVSTTLIPFSVGNIASTTLPTSQATIYYEDNIPGIFGTTTPSVIYSSITRVFDAVFGKIKSYIDSINYYLYNTDVAVLTENFADGYELMWSYAKGLDDFINFPTFTIGVILCGIWLLIFSINLVLKLMRIMKGG